jgi:hypothetical protein
MLTMLSSLRPLGIAFLATSLFAAEPGFEWVAAGGGAKSDKPKSVNGKDDRLP